MNRTQAKARAAELGISKEEVRAFGNLSKTQTWLDAIAAQASGGIAAHEATFQGVLEAGENEVTDIAEQSEASEIHGEQHLAVDALEEADNAVEAPVPPVASPELDVEETFLEEPQPSPIVAEASFPMLPDPWDEPEAPVEPATNAWKSGTLKPLDQAEPASASRPVPAKHDSEPTKAPPDASALVYPLLLLGIAVWAAYQLLVGLGSLMSLGLHHVAKQSIPATRVRLEQKASMAQPAARRSTRSLSQAIQPAQLQPDG